MTAIQFKTSVARQVTGDHWLIVPGPWMKQHHQLVHRWGISPFRYSKECLEILNQIVMDFDLKPRDLGWYP